jgi:hypothetical protein
VFVKCFFLKAFVELKKLSGGACNWVGFGVFLPATAWGFGLPKRKKNLQNRDEMHQRLHAVAHYGEETAKAENILACT